MALFSKLQGPQSEGKSVDEFPPRDFPVIYCDGILSAVRATPNVKFFLYRMDPHPFAQGGANQMPTHQVVMPNDAFGASAIFFLETLALLVETNQAEMSALDRCIEICTNAKAKAKVAGHA